MSTATYKLMDDGRIITNITNAVDGQWWSLSPALTTDIGDLYNVLVTVVSTDGGTVSGTFDTLVSLSTSPEWSLDSPGVNTLIMTVQIFDVLTNTLQDNATVTLNTLIIPDNINLTDVPDGNLRADRDSDGGSPVATQAIRFTTAGFFQERHNDGPGTNTLTAYADISGHSGEWADSEPSDIGDSYEIFLTVTNSVDGTGTVVFSGDTQDVWLSLSTERSWTLTNSGFSLNTQSSRTMDISIRRSSDMVVVATAEVVLEADLSAS